MTVSHTLWTSMLVNVPWYVQYHRLSLNSEKWILSCSSISSILESLFLYWPSRSLTPGYQLSKMVRYSFAPWFKGGFHSARQFCFASKQNWTMSFAGKEARYFSSQHPPKQGFFFCQQEELGRKCPFVQCNAQSPLVFMAFTSWWIGRMRYKA